jgi:hypothetical protein
MIGLPIGHFPAIASAVARSIRAATEINHVFELTGDFVVATNGKIAEIAGEGEAVDAVANVSGIIDAAVMHLGLDADANRTVDHHAFAPFLNRVAL